MAYLYRIDDVEGGLTDCWALHDRPLVVGRGEAANIRVVDDSLSRSHFMLARESGHIVLIDLQSRNGTWVNGDRVTGKKLLSGELIRAGKSLFYFSRDRVVPEAPPVKPLAPSLPSAGADIVDGDFEARAA